MTWYISVHTSVAVVGLHGLLYCIIQAVPREVYPVWRGFQEVIWRKNVKPCVSWTRCRVKRAVTLLQMGVSVVPIEQIASVDDWRRCNVRFAVRMHAQVSAAVVEFRYAEVLFATAVTTCKWELCRHAFCIRFVQWKCQGYRSEMPMMTFALSSSTPEHISECSWR
jgi:hypothetical protein